MNVTFVFYCFIVFCSLLQGNLVLLLTNEDPSQRPEAKDLTEQNDILIKEFKQLIAETD